MALTKYSNQKIGPAKLAVIEQANVICDDYASQGLSLTLRQLYYQFVARGLLDNKQSEYKRLGDICNDARMNGLMDWDHLIDRTRNLQTYRVWASPEALIKDSAERFHKDVWKPQKRRIEVWVEKDAAIGVIEGVCSQHSIPYFATRGYGSVSEYHAAAQRIRWYIEAGEQVTILHIGDHDPSGLDMTRDIEDRLRQFLAVDWAGLHLGPGAWTRGQIRMSMIDHMLSKDSKINLDEKPWEIKRIALNHDQVLQYSPPPNPVKQSDSRFERYVEETGLMESWELDALDPTVLASLIEEEVLARRDDDLWMDSDAEMEFERETLKSVSSRWADVQRLVSP